MRILVVHRPLPGRASVTRGVTDSVAALRRAGHQVAVTRGPDEEAPEADAWLDLRWPAPGRIAAAMPGLGTGAGLRRRIERFVEAHRPDVVHLHCAGGPLPGLLPAPGPRSVPWVLSLHDATPVCPAGTLFSGGAICERCLHGDLSPAVVRRCVDGDLLRSTGAALATRSLQRRGHYTRAADLTLVPSVTLAQLLSRGGQAVESLAVLAPGVADPGPPVPVPDDEAAPILYHGPLTPERGLETLLTAYAMLGPDRPPLRLVGDGPLAASLGSLGERLDLDRFTLHPAVDDAALADELAACRFSVLPSVGHEFAPREGLQSLAHGRAVVATRRGALPEWIDDGVGRLVEPRDANALAAALDGLARDAVLAEHLGARARERFEERHTNAHHAEQLSEVYQAVIAGRVDELVAQERALLSPRV